MKKYISITVLIVILSMIFAGCGPIKESVGEKAASAVSSTPVTTQEAGKETSAVQYPLTVKDYSGFEMTFEKRPEAIISLTLATDEILVDMVDQTRLKAIEVFSEDEGVSNIVEKAKAFPVKLNAELEKIIEMQPDLVFVADWKEKEFVQQLRDAKIPVYVFKAPTSFADLNKAITDVSTLVDEVEKGKQLLESVAAKLKAIDDKVKTIKPEDQLSVFDYTFYGTTYAKGTSFDELVNKAGLINAATKAGLEGWPEVSKEKLIEMDPDIILLPSWSFDKKTDPQQFADNFKKDKSFASLKAVKNNRVYIMQDRHLQDNAQYMATGVEDLAKVAYPDLFK